MEGLRTASGFVTAIYPWRTAAHEAVVVLNLVFAAEIGGIRCGSYLGMRIGGNDGLKVAPLSAATLALASTFVQPFLAYTAHIVPAFDSPSYRIPKSTPASCKRVAKVLGDFLVTRIEGRVVADEPQHFHRFLARVFDLERQGFAPRPPLALRFTNELPVL